MAGSSVKTKSKAGGPSSGGKQRPCCLNGGLCVLGSFCHCPDQYYGRHCEHRVSEKPCRHVQHGSWVKAGCNLCRCVNGYMTCLPRAFDGCDDKPLTEEEPSNIWEYEDQMVVFAGLETTTSKYDAEDPYYADYYEDYGDGQNSFTARPVADASLVVLCGVVGRIVWAWMFWRLGSS
ncbi:uncharacterized protein LOC143294650 [Babylonia areolata]|uniref:uncharacterized protein LOC143294650 n=1 Tax=Babylonia areolata TaxID=304850 RepID=UPI003FD06162